MCGIFGAVGVPLSDGALDTLWEVLDHRGPDGRGVYMDESAHVTIAHTRLAVIDLETGTQPLESNDGTVILAANGEIYDFERIRQSLEAKGHTFKTRSDSEVIIGLYQEYGLEAIEQLRGEFAFLLYDRGKRHLVAARDRFGIKPLYLSRLPEGFAFASEMKALFASGLVVPKLNVAAFDPLLDHDHCNPQLPFEGVTHVPPGTYMLLDLASGEAKTVRYWSGEIPDPSAEPRSEHSQDAEAVCARRVLQDLEEAVRLRLRADVPVGLYLSGGLDSAFIAALMARNLDAPPHSFSIVFAGSQGNEQEFARRAAEFVGTEHHELIVTKDMLWDNLEHCLWHSELPFVSLAPVGKFLLSELARKFVTVVLTGEGADELFLGYRSFFGKAVRDSGSPEAERAFSLQLRRLKLDGTMASIALRLSLLAFNKRQRSRIRSLRTRPSVNPPREKPLINVAQEARIAAMPFDILCFLGDREEMAHSLEARLPFLDHKLYETAKWIPVDFKLRQGLEKAVLRDAAKGILPDDLRLRRKSGFMLTSDAVDFFGSDRRAWKQLRRHLSRHAFESAGLFSYRAYRTAALLARLPQWKGFGCKQIRRNSNKLIMYMIQAHMLHEMFVVDRNYVAPASPGLGR